MERKTYTIALEEEELGALMFLLGKEIGWLCAHEGTERSGEIEFYKALAFKLNGTDGENVTR